MSYTEKLKGVIPPMVTPVISGTEEIDEEGVKKIVEHLIAGGVDGIFALGTCGEFACFDNDTKKRYLELLLQQVAGRVPVYVGITDTSTERSIAFYRQIADLPFDFIVASPPFYYVYKQEQIKDYYRRLADTVRVPLLIYNIPQMTKNDVELATVWQLSEHPNIMGIKDSSTDFVKFQEMVNTIQSDNFKVLQGAESLSAASLLIGADGIIPGLANIIPHWFVGIYEAVQKGDFKKARDLQARVNRLSGIFQYDSWLSGLKLALEVLGLCSSVPCHPYPVLQGEARQAVEKLVKDLLEGKGVK